MRNTFKVLFYIKKTAPLRNGNVPIMGRITINGQCTQFATQLSVQPELWNVSFSCVMGRSALATRINEQLTRIRLRIELCYNRLSFEHGAITPVMVKEAYRGLNFDQEMVVAFFKRHNEEFEQMIGISRSKSTLYKYQCVCRHLESYIMHRYGCRDLPFRKLDEKFVPGFHTFILQEQCLYDCVKAYFVIGPKPGLHGQGSLCRLPVEKRKCVSELSHHRRVESADTIPAPEQNHANRAGCFSVQLPDGTVLYRHMRPYGG